MLRLCSHSSRPYTPQGGTEKSPGRPVRRGVVFYDSALCATHRVIGQESAEAIVCAGQRTDQEG